MDKKETAQHKQRSMLQVQFKPIAWLWLDLTIRSLKADLVGQVDVAIGVCRGPLSRVVSQRRLSYSDRRLWRVALLQLRNTVLLLLFQKWVLGSFQCSIRSGFPSKEARKEDTSRWKILSKTSKTFFQFLKPRPSQLLVREISILSIAFFASFHFSVFKSVLNWKFRKIAVGNFCYPRSQCFLPSFPIQLLPQFSHCFISILINFQAPNRLPHRYPNPNGLLSTQ